MNKSDSNNINEAHINTSMVTTAIKSSEEAAGKAAPKYSAKVKAIMDKIKLLLQRKKVKEDAVKILKKKILAAGIKRDQIKIQNDSNPEWVKTNEEFRKLVQQFKLLQRGLESDNTIIGRMKMWAKKRADKRAWDDERDIAIKKAHAKRGRVYITGAEARAGSHKLGALTGLALLAKRIRIIRKKKEERRKKCTTWTGNKELCNLIVELSYLKEVHGALSSVTSNVNSQEEKIKVSNMIDANVKQQNEVTAKIAEMKKSVKKSIKENTESNISEMKHAVKEIVKESGCSSLNEYISHLLELDDTAPRPHSSLHTKNEKITNAAIGLGFGTGYAAGVVADTYKRSPKVAAIAGSMVMGASLLGLAVGKLIEYYTDSCRKLAARSNDSKQRKIIYYSCQVSTCKKIIEKINKQFNSIKDIKVRKRLQNYINMWEKRLDEKQSLLRKAISK